MNVKDIRRHNLRIVARTMGGINELAKLLNRGQSQLSHLIGKRPRKNIGDKLASEIEIALNQPPGWLDKEHTDYIDFAQVIAKILVSPINAIETTNTKHVVKNLKANLLTSIEENFSTMAEILFEKGKTIGVQQGKDESLQAIAIRLLTKGKKIHLIAEITGLSVEQIHQLHEKISEK